MTRIRFKVIEAFDIEGRGVVIVGNQRDSAVVVMKECCAEVKAPNGQVIKTAAFKEWVLRKALPTPDETEAFLLRGRSKMDVPVGSEVTITQD